MADYRKILTGTMETLVTKAKEIAESDAVTGAVDRVKEAAINTGISEVYEKGAQRAKSFGNATKLTLDLNRDHTELERIYAEIGRRCYEQMREKPEGFFAPLFGQVEAMQETIRAKEAELAAYKAGFAEKNDVPHDEIDDFEAIVNRTEDDGTAR